MAYGSVHPVQVRHHDTGRHVAAWAASVLGLVAAALGAYIALAPDDGTVTVNGRTWAAADLATWGPWLLIVGGVVAGVGMIGVAVLDQRQRASLWLVAAAGVLAVIGVVAAISGIVLLV